MTTMRNRQRWHSAIGMTNLQDTPSEGPITAEDLARHWPNCGGPCDGGRRLCQVPEACQRLERHGREINRYSRVGAELAAWVLAALIVVAVVHLAMRLYDMARSAQATAVGCAVKTT